MKTNIQNKLFSLVAAASLIAFLTGCKDMFSDPLKDKNTGEKVTILLLDRNFIKTKLDIRVQDAATLKDIDQEEVEIRFTGKDAADLINFSGNKMTTFKTSSGFTEVGYDPNLLINDQNPLELTLIAVSLNYISAPRFVSYTTEGIKNLEIRMIRKISGKSMTTTPFGEPFDLSYNDVLHSPQLRFGGDITSMPTGTSYEYYNLYATGVNGSLLCNNLIDNILYSDYGAYYFGLSGGSQLAPPALPSKSAGLQAGDYVFSTFLRSGMLKCEKGLTIQVERADKKAGTGVFDYRITFSKGTPQTGQVTCTFPSGNLVEPIYYPGSNSAVSVELFGDAQYTMSAAVNLTSPCGTEAAFFATPRSNLKTYKFVTQYSCPDSNTGLALTITGEFRKTGTLGLWTSFEFKEGVCELMLEENADYDFRVNIDSEYHTYTLPLDPSKVEAALREGQSVDYRLKSLVIEEGETIVITADVEFSQGVCDDIR